MSPTRSIGSSAFDFSLDFEALWIFLAFKKIVLLYLVLLEDCRTRWSILFYRVFVVLVVGARVFSEMLVMSTNNNLAPSLRRTRQNIYTAGPQTTFELLHQCSRDSYH